MLNSSSSNRIENTIDINNNNNNKSSPLIQWRNEMERLECHYQAKIDDLEYRLNQDRLLHSRELDGIVKEYEDQLATLTSIHPIRVVTCDAATSTTDLTLESQEIESLKSEQSALRSILDLNEFIMAGFDTEAQEIPFDAKWKPSLMLALLKCWRQRVFALMVQRENLETKHSNQMEEMHQLLSDRNNEIRRLQKELTLAKASTVSLRSDYQLKALALTKLHSKIEDLQGEKASLQSKLDPYLDLENQFGLFTKRLWKINSVIDKYVEGMTAKIASVNDNIQLLCKKLSFIKEMKKHRINNVLSNQRSIAVETDLRDRDIRIQVQALEHEKSNLLKKLQVMEDSFRETLREKETAYEKEIKTLLGDLHLLQKQVVRLERSNTESMLQTPKPNRRQHHILHEKPANPDVSNYSNILSSTPAKLIITTKQKLADDSSNSNTPRQNLISKLENLQLMADSLLEKENSNNK